MLRLTLALLTMAVVLWTLPAAAGSSVALIDVTHPADPDWRDQDSRLLSLFQKALEARSALVLMPSSEVESFFREPLEPSAGPLNERAREDLQRGREFSEQLKPDKAIRHLVSALRTLRAIFPYLPGLQDLEEAHLQLGMTYQALGKEADAAEQYRMVLLLNPQRELDESQVNPVVVERFSKVRQELMTSLKGSVSLISTPPGGRVIMDGRPVGVSPLTIPGVFPGDHYFSLELNGFKTWFGIVKVAPGGMEKKEVFPVEGVSIQRVRVRSRLAEAGIGQARREDAQWLADGLKVDWLVVASIAHPSGRATIEVVVFAAGDKEVSPLGVFPAEESKLGELAQRVKRWIQGDRSVAVPTVVQEPPPKKREDLVPPPPPIPPPPTPSTPWYQTWWFWTAVGVAVTGATVGTALALTRESGIRIEVYR